MRKRKPEVTKVVFLPKRADNLLTISCPLKKQHAKYVWDNDDLDMHQCSLIMVFYV